MRIKWRVDSELGRAWKNGLIYPQTCIVLIQGRLYQLAMLAVSAIDTQRVSVRYKMCQLLLRNYIDKLL